ncbi:type VII secretion protein EssC [Listeria monocytogenes]|uniref:type VII secretion protein EssC n=1 Tax=Listeria monocytogenes TaxID=1639 RepID=UPI00085CA9DD|nr:type VII secretion protein EssC [Listeria monocytogenes]EAD7630623.1 type VII secretion protein EssC [Listeria monocytogenes]EAG9488817.1 type VII secretion protein EssC [Listeria monocytogenes]EFQ9069908.1 type VII secretion protein EssC [Listeria monocytogenes]EGU0987682.1 type VII secretion protein EssC [Listeria monocytogenes]EHR3640966.1 type VII secretion protein EssC [Listeria monocytogenes]
MNREALLIVSNGQQCHKHHLSPERVVTIGNTIEHEITYPELAESIEVKYDEGSWNAGTTALQANQAVNVENLAFYLCQDLHTQVYDVVTNISVTFGVGIENDVTLDDTKSDFILLRDTKEGLFKLQVLNGEIYHNFSLVTEDCTVEPGDQLYTDGVTITIGKEDISVLAVKNRVTSKLAPLFAADNSFGEDYPDYHRSPRIIYRAPEEKISMAKPSSKPSKPTDGLIKIILPPLIMVAITVMISIFQPRGLYIIMTIAMSAVTITMAILNYIKSRKKYKIDSKQRVESYDLYLKRKTKELHETSEKQRHALTYHYPDVTELEKMALRVDSRIYEKTMFHHDFLTFRVGRGDEASSFSVEFQQEEFSQEKDELVEEAVKIKGQYLSINEVPVATDLMHGPVGYIGPRRLVLEQLQMLVMQTSLFHSYYDLQFITIFPEEEKADWDWMRWLPHANMRDVNVRGFVYHERSRDQVLNSLYQILKERKQALTEQASKQEKLYFTPHYVVLITDEKLVLDHTVMEFFNEDPSELGVSLVFVQDVMESLPEHVKTVVDIRDAKSGNIILEQGDLVNRAFVPDHLPADFDKEVISRALAPLNHLQNLKNSIPESVTFLEMYGVERVEELNIAGRWAKNETYKSLAVPLGLRGKDDIVQLNLHEKAHGPHGLVAGTTGSGKSEIIQSYIISLGVNFHPYEVAFLLIDYKGGGMANLFKNMPHLLGTITNLDGAQSMRALASIKAELQKRQRLFGEHDVNHINQYQKLYKQGKATEPMPHLFLISDEFAELKSEQPEFMKELVSTARIGRSLGIHLILATQKPSGVVDDQIWSNSKFKLALKVQNASDSNEILKTPDAAEITLPGRSYLQVGNNEIYELFQSAWSGADYVPDKESTDYIDTTIYAINDLGQYDILTEDLSGLDKKDDLTKLPSELDAVIDHIHEYTEASGIEALPRPWLPPLPERIFAQDLHPVNFEEAWKEPKKPLQATIGLLDQPELQAQVPLTLDLTKDGHVAVFSSPGFGKSTFLQSLVMDLARQHNPEQLHVYLLDFGTNGLLPLAKLPHTVDLLNIDNEEKLRKFTNRMNELISDRKKLLSENAVANLSQFEEITKEVLPEVLVLIDNYDAIRETDFSFGFESTLTQIAREGNSVGIHLVMSATRQNSMRQNLLANLKLQLALYMIEGNEVKSIVGQTKLTVAEFAGRGLVKLEDPTLFQASFPTRSNSVTEHLEYLDKEILQMSKHGIYKVVPKIPMLPDKIGLDELISKKSVQQSLANHLFVIGLDEEAVESFAVNKINQLPLLVTGENGFDISNAIKQFIDLESKDFESKEIIVIDNMKYDFSKYQNDIYIYGNNKTFMETIIQNSMNEYEERRKVVTRLREENRTRIEIEEQLANMPEILLFITDLSSVIESVEAKYLDMLEKMLGDAAVYKVFFTIGASLGSLSGYDSLSKTVKAMKNVLLFTDVKQQSVINVVSKSGILKPLKPFEAYYIDNKIYSKVKVAYVKEEE